MKGTRGRVRGTVAGVSIALLALGSGCARRSDSPPDEIANQTLLVAYVGCSLTLAAVTGNVEEGGTSFWPVADVSATYPGGSVYQWYEDYLDPISSTTRWTTFEAALSKYPQTTTIWWHMCPLNGSPDDQIPTCAETVDVLKKIQADTGAKIYASATPPAPGATDTSDCDALYAYLDTMLADSSLKVNKGPVLDQLTQDEMSSDGRHPNDAGARHWGQQLENFAW